jgi:5-methyltetrahydropteroyltriglutamate--homocysteine methyltransferase
MALPTEPIGSVPRPRRLLQAIADFQAGSIQRVELDQYFEAALRETIERFEATGSPVITDGEQTKPSFITYPLEGLDNLAPDGIAIPFADGHARQLPRLTTGPFRYARYAAGYLDRARELTRVPVKQAIVAPSAMTLLYPRDGIRGYSREAFLADVASEAETDIRRCVAHGAYKVQLDITEARLAVKLDPSKQLLGEFLELVSRVLASCTSEERGKIGIHTCPGADRDSSHSLDVDYAEFLPSLLTLDAGSFYIQLASEPDPGRVLKLIRDHAAPEAWIFVGVVDPIDPRVESVQDIRDRILRAADYLGTNRLGTCDDCGFSPFGDDTSTSRDIAFAKIAARVEGTALAAEQLGETFAPATA